MMNERTWWIVVFLLMWVTLLYAIVPVEGPHAPAGLIALLTVGFLIAMFRGPIRFK